MLELLHRRMSLKVYDGFTAKWKMLSSEDDKMNCCFFILWVVADMFSVFTYTMIHKHAIHLLN